MSAAYIIDNAQAWELRTGVHLQSSFYDVQSFLQGKTTLNAPELNLLPDVIGERLLHLQCHFGLDTLSWCRLGAQATGVNFSASAVSAAKELSQKSGVEAFFVQADVQNLGDVIGENHYDNVYSSYGVLCWLQRLNTWAAGIRKSLSAGEKFVLVEFHPLLDFLYDGKVSGVSDFDASDVPTPGISRGTYTDPDAPIEYTERRWQHLMSSVINALVQAKLVIESAQELAHTPYRLFPDREKQEDGLWTSAAKRMPYLSTIVAKKLAAGSVP